MEQLAGDNKREHKRLRLLHFLRSLQNFVLLLLTILPMPTIARRVVFCYSIKLLAFVCTTRLTAPPTCTQKLASKKGDSFFSVLVECSSRQQQRCVSRFA